MTEKLDNNITRLIPEDKIAVYIPLRKTLKIFLEIPNLFSSVIDYMKKLSNDTSIISNFVQGELWRNKNSSKL